MYPSVGPNLTKRALTPDDLNAIRNLYPPESGAGPNLISGTGPSTESVSTSSVSASDAGAPVSWKFLGGTFEGEPAVVSMFAGHLDIFVRGNDSYVWHKAYQDGNGWWPSQGDWEQLGNSLQILSDVTAVSWGSSRIDIFGRGIDNSVQHRAWTGSSWTGWENLGGQCIGNICASTGGENNLHVFIRGMDNGVYHKSFNGSWTPDWENLGGKILGQPRAVSWGDSHSAGVGRVDVFVRGTDNAAYQKTWTGAVWEPAGKDWRRLGGIIMDDVVPVVSSPTSIDLFVLGTNNAVFQKTFNGTRWLPSDTDWTSLGGTLMSNPAATTWGGNRIEIFGQGTDNAVWQNSYDGSAWSGWKTLGGVITESPVVTTRGSSRPQVFVRGTNAALYESV
ncbi:fucose-specific lectin [Wilcoxina mikolae CBS 423.85]|nr:fucose-specific lectin [Wilcoxina mikolae CBS 423.85]